MTNPILIAKNKDITAELLPSMANRHGLITGATGTGKTVTLQKIAESFSEIGVPVFMADIKGDLTGISQEANISGKLAETLKSRGLEIPAPSKCPVTLWDVFGEKGHPVRATISNMGPLLLSRMLRLNDTQTGVLNLVFKIADDNGLLLIDVKDLRSMLQYVGENSKQFTTEYGNISAASIGAIQRNLLQLDTQGADKFFGEPMLNLQDMMQTEDGKGVINILAADKLMQSPALYSTFLLWILSELYESLPEIGDVEKPKFALFFDEAHLLFKDAPKVLLERIELVVRLIRSKGVSVFFITQNPMDVPDTVLAQLGNRVQHALRAYTPRDQKAVKATAQTMRANPEIDIESAITELSVGQALISFLDEKASPSITQKLYVYPPASRLGPITEDERSELIKKSIVAGVYDQTIDNESAYEMLQAKAGKTAGQSQTQEASDANSPLGGMGTMLKEALFGRTGPRGGQYDGLVQSMLKSEARKMGRNLLRGALGSLIGRK